MSDSAAYIVAAVRAMHFPHLICFTLTLNLIVQHGIKVIKPLQDKMKKISKHFRRRTVVVEKLKSLQLKL